ncbi:exported protein of unknown function [Candidatus Filomicrobium marinum]|uniref:L,D-TPase catalytic domain-containing protein n=2 Tax=Filomicrobium TaxID=119044 RepID=A0A0D6JHP5_9HYPH|nr:MULTISPECIES: L,D-transpeptidase family protein [Filomicrobium]CFX48223.1 exported protein of unknown function [Candidatus Filomicrobium marinum]CPR20450.1 exported protein of unknown function [Candidatus Filomicrobium marinum]SDP15226.1 Murein L,D-transpeptidase YcbB/YkuD [Filomicrobium insigne]
MRLAVLFVSSLVLVAGSPLVDARESSSVDPAIDVTVGEQDDLKTAILRDITERKPRADETMTRWLDELGTLYATEFDAPLWVSYDGLTAAGKSVIAELKRADEWGLDPNAFTANIPVSIAKSSEEMALAEVEITLAALTYAVQAQGGRLDPTELSLWYERAKVSVDAAALMRGMKEASDPATVLVAQQPQHPQFLLLRQAYLKRKFPERFASAEEKPTEAEPEPIKFSYGKRVARGQRNEQIPQLRERLEVPAADPEDEDLYDQELVDAVTKFMRTQGWRRKTVFDDKVRKALNNPKDGDSEETETVSLQQILVNMEKWRWLPRDLGELRIWNNLPAYTTELIRGDQVLFSERIIVGKESTQTPVFSDKMSHVIFKPEWGVPSSIKIKSLLPSLASGDYDVLARRGMRIQHEGRPISPARYNWAKTDIRSIPIVMGAGASNPLGRVKFMFPNHHAVYMHDTPDKHLFDNSKRNFSHGCIRVRDPLQFAELLLRETAGWSRDDVAAQLSRGAEENHRVDLPTPVPVHNVYFTVIAEEDGTLSTLKDVYGHDKRITQALQGKSLSAIAASDPARAQKREMEQLAKSGAAYAMAREDYEFYDYQGYNNGGGYGGGYYLFSSSSGSSYGGPPQGAKPKKKKSVHTWSLNPYQHGFNSD